MEKQFALRLNEEELSYLAKMVFLGAMVLDDGKQPNPQKALTGAVAQKFYRLVHEEMPWSMLTTLRPDESGPYAYSCDLEDESQWAKNNFLQGWYALPLARELGERDANDMYGPIGFGGETEERKAYRWKKADTYFEELEKNGIERLWFMLPIE